jgi:hypothetical protein
VLRPCRVVFTTVITAAAHLPVRMDCCINWDHQEIDQTLTKPYIALKFSKWPQIILRRCIPFIIIRLPLEAIRDVLVNFKPCEILHSIRRVRNESVRAHQEIDQTLTKPYIALKFLKFQ